jgi:transcriptional regulator with XRE-family HTH domain
MAISERLKRIRRLAGLSQVQLANQVGVSEMTVRRWENGERDPGASALKLIAEVLDTSVAYLVGETDELNSQISFGQRIKNFRGDRAIKEIADKVGISEELYTDIEEGRFLDIDQYLLQIAKALDVTLAELLGGVLDPKTGQIVITRTLYPNPQDLQKVRNMLEAPKPPEVKSDGNLISVTWVPVIGPEVKACCGVGNLYAEDVEWKISGYYPVPDSYLIGYQWQTDGFHSMAVEGDSMEPKIHDGDLVLFAKLDLLTGDFVVLKYNGRLIVRAIKFFTREKIQLSPLNDEYEKIDIDLTDREDESTEFYVLGKVLMRLPKPEKLTGLY